MMLKTFFIGMVALLRILKASIIIVLFDEGLLQFSSSIEVYVMYVLWLLTNLILWLSTIKSNNLIQEFPPDI